MRAALALVALVGCSAATTSPGIEAGADATSVDAGVDVAGSACSRDTRAELYVAGIEKKATTLTVKIVSASPAPPSKETNAWTIEVTDNATKAAITTAQITVTPFMPDHAHGSSHTPKVTESGAGKYEVNDIYYMMPGLWRTTVSVVRQGGVAAEDGVFNFCVDG